MISSEFSRSNSLNTVPKKKLQQKIFDAISKCQDCSNKNPESDLLCKKCSMRSVAYNRFAESNIPIEYWDLKMNKDFVGYPALKEKYDEIVLDMKKTYFLGKSYCFAGAHGLGKTTTATNILKCANLKGYTALYTTLSDVVNVLTAASFSEKYEARRELVMVDFLTIDEVDNRFIASENASDLYARTLEVVFRARSQNKLPTFICTNSPNIVEAFNGALKASMDSLFNGYMEFIPILGEDFRKKQT
jgi:DNA replication protein DnaC